MIQKHELPQLSNDAKSVIGGFFAMRGGSSIQFAMRESKPSERMSEALGQLVAAGVCAVETSPCGTVTWTCLEGFDDLRKQCGRDVFNGKIDGKFQIAVPIR